MNNYNQPLWLRNATHTRYNEYPIKEYIVEGIPRQRKRFMENIFTNQAFLNEAKLPQNRYYVHSPTPLFLVLIQELRLIILFQNFFNLLGE
jgi:hypothetical protein